MYFLINLRSRSVTMIIDDNVTIFILNKALNAQASYLSHDEKGFNEINDAVSRTFYFWIFLN